MICATVTQQFFARYPRLRMLGLFVTFSCNYINPSKNEGFFSVAQFMVEMFGVLVLMLDMSWFPRKLSMVDFPWISCSSNPRCPAGTWDPHQMTG